MSRSYNFEIDPRDVLFFRDGKAMEASDAGLGANLPRPDQVYSAFINAFHRHFPEVQEWEHKHTKTDRDKKNSSDRFGGLKSAGPFPLHINESGKTQIYLPCPADVMPSGKSKAAVLKLMKSAKNNLPEPLTHVVAASTSASKDSLPEWWSVSEYVNYLKGEKIHLNEKRVNLFSAERNIGIAIDPETGATIENKLYQAEYLRLRSDVRLAVNVKCEATRHDSEPLDVFSKIIEADRALSLIMGGQQGVVFYKNQQKSMGLPNQIYGTGNTLRWTLLSPAVYQRSDAHPGGWLPSFIDNTGKVMLKNGNCSRKTNEKRPVWRQRIKELPVIKARLIAACLKTPMHFSGWSNKVSTGSERETAPGAKQTHLAVPAGSVFYFSGESSELQKLAKLLQWNGDGGEEVINRRSGSFGEKGFGLGICSFINI